MATGRIGVTPTLRTRWSEQPTAGTTVLSGLDDNSVALVYDAGYEAVYRNGVLLSRGNDYTATDGTTITLIDATLAGDIIEVFANDLVPLTDAISKAQFTAKGALLSASAASTPGVVTVGANDTVLTADSSTATGLKWAVPAGGGKVLQVVQGTRTSDTSTTSGSLVDTNLTVTITPTLATSKIMIFVSHPKVKLTRTGTAPANYGSFVLLRGATQLQESMTGSEEYTYNNGVFHNSIPFSYLDSPATTSATTYKTQFSVINANITALISGSATVINSIVAMEIGA